MDTEHVCPICHHSFVRTRKDQYYCPACKADYDRAWNETHPDRRRNHRKAGEAKTQAIALDDTHLVMYCPRCDAETTHALVAPISHAAASRWYCPGCRHIRSVSASELKEYGFETKKKARAAHHMSS